MNSMKREAFNVQPPDLAEIRLAATGSLSIDE